MTPPLPGEVYDLRSAGEMERDVPPRLYRVVEVLPEVFDGAAGAMVTFVRCRSVPSEVLREWPLRLFTPERRTWKAP